MELTIANNASRLILERSDNGAVLYETNEENFVTSKTVYELYRRDGILNFSSIIDMFSDILELIKIPSEDKNANSRLTISISPIDEKKDSSEK